MLGVSLIEFFDQCIDGVFLVVLQIVAPLVLSDGRDAAVLGVFSKHLNGGLFQNGDGNVRIVTLEPLKDIQAFTFRKSLDGIVFLPCLEEAFPCLFQLRN